MNKKLDRKKQKQVHRYVRATIQLIFFLLVPSAFTAAFSGVKYLFTQIGKGDAIGMTSFVTALCVLCLYTILFGRFFCGFACAFGSFGDALHGIYLWICKKIRKKPYRISEKITKYLYLLKYIVLAMISLLCYAGVYAKTGINADRVLLELGKIAFVNAIDVINMTDATVLTDASRDDTAAIASVKVKVIPGEDGDGVEREVRLADKLKALELCGKHLGMFKDSPDSTAPVTVVINYDYGPDS